jgi:hypothetical protein
MRKLGCRPSGNQHGVLGHGEHLGIIERVMQAPALVAGQRRTHDQVGELPQVAQLNYSVARSSNRATRVRP